MSDKAIERLIDYLARLPGLGPRSARRAALALVKRRERLLLPLAQAMADVAREVRPCPLCGNLTTEDICSICRDPKRDATLICVVSEVADLWAMERSGAFRGRYFVLGGTLSALDGVTPEMLRIPDLAQRVRSEGVREVVLALNATVEGQTTAHVIAEHLGGTGARLSSLAQGVPIGGELDYLDDGTLSAALAARRPL
ncbi:MAG: recombination mediator RecR [Pseudomonadota bacterium]